MSEVAGRMNTPATDERTLPTENFGFLLVSGFPLAAFASAIDVLALANYVSGKTLYRWSTVSVDGDSVEAMNGLNSVADWKIENAPRYDVITVCCGIGAARRRDDGLEEWLRCRHKMGARVGSMSTGSWLLARAGLLDGKRCTIHWEDLESFRESYPNLPATSEIFEIDGRIFTCSGGSAATDLYLSLVAEDHGLELASRVAEQLVRGPARADTTNQRLKLQDRLGIRSPHLASAVALMEQHIEEPLAQSDIARLVGISGRQLERLFHNHLGRTPQLYYREVRLRHAQSLLRKTGLTVMQVASASGFCTASYLAKCYLAHFGHPPNSEMKFS